MFPLSREPAERVGCGGMHRIVILMAVLTSAIAPQSNITGIEQISSSMKINVVPTSQNIILSMINKSSKLPARKGKGDSPMLNYIFDSYATSNKHFHDKFRAPSFEGGISSEDTIIEADTGSTVLFDCQVSSLRDKTVSWIKVSENENLELLTINLDTYTADNRYRVDVAGETWRLFLSNVKVQDSGVYCCHVSTHPPMLKRFQLTVHKPEMMMNKEAFLESGENLSLKCSVFHLNSGDVTPELHWYRGNTSAPIDEIRGGVFIETDHITMTSHLQVARLKVEDAGNYTCSLEAPVQMRTVARVHVLQGSSLAELQSGVKSQSSYISLLFSSILINMVLCVDTR
ncbi:unnamed protein product [Parnassius apollo]|uniref:(apollo) hypothetical protein n=1 Tax=Parnassius apollo TaxID=110799 RepID=A0A8S3WJ38_PARAO|nr:unnamed protein product [Parnassius apollo]